MPYKDPQKQREAQHQWYLEKQQDTVAQRSKIARDKRKEWYDRLKEGSCIDCGKSYPPRVMDYHHLDGADKILHLSGALKSWSKERILAEIEKCVLLCANCHRLRH